MGQGSGRYSQKESGHTEAKTVSRRPSPAAARDRARLKSCGICGGQSGTGADFLLAPRFLLLLIYSTSRSIIITIHHPELIK
jgi:hypothetical protein